MMRACFLGQNVCTLGFGVAMVQTPPLPEPSEAEPEAKTAPSPDDLPLENFMARDLKRQPGRIV
jgi:hypothetical protein